jgi:cell division protein FtsA
MEEIVETVHTEIITSGFDSKLAGGIVLTGGGSQLSNLQQLVEYMSGMDARIGYPNEHLGKSKMEIVKSPMFATSVGLVLSGYRALDERENRYHEAKAKGSFNSKRKERIVVGDSFFRKMLDRTKNLLIDDFDEKEEY